MLRTLVKTRNLVYLAKRLGSDAPAAAPAVENFKPLKPLTPEELAQVEKFEAKFGEDALTPEGFVNSTGLPTYEEFLAVVQKPNVPFLELVNTYKAYQERVIILNQLKEAKKHAEDIYSETGDKVPSFLSRFTNPGAERPFFSDRDFLDKVMIPSGVQKWTPEEIEEAIFTPFPSPFSITLYADSLKTYRTLRKLGWRGTEQGEVSKKYRVSVGSSTLEWMTPSPAPFHTFEEPPIIKEAPSYKEDDY